MKPGRCGPWLDSNSIASLLPNFPSPILPHGYRSVQKASMTLQKQNTTRDVAQRVEFLASMHRALGSIPGTS